MKIKIKIKKLALLLCTAILVGCANKSDVPTYYPQDNNFPSASEITASTVNTASVSTEPVPTTETTVTTTQTTTETSTETTTQTTTNTTQTTATSATTKKATPTIDMTAPIQEEDTTWAYFLVNSENLLPTGYAPKLDVVQGRYKLDARAAKYAKKMIAAAKLDGVTLTVISAYRTMESQATRFNSYLQDCLDLGNSYEYSLELTRRYIQLPGASEHNAGLSIDFNQIKYAFDSTKAYKWLQANAHKYGFVMRYLDTDKIHQDGVAYEPWHYRFIGFEYAEIIKNSGLTLEQYMANGS
ncbi:MAG: M15 family metallopeptidase [Oscillospiraceae bacterium]|jgi:D-alanyl-D-alanine carboxypeptidase|nr:M15 family metallopeptidase [Oscillospiraceae bacterium]